MDGSQPIYRDPDIGRVRAAFEANAPFPDAPAQTTAEQRAWYDGWGGSIPCPEGCAFEAVDAGGVPAERLSPAGAQQGRAILYLHGGGYVIGSPVSHRHLAARLAQAAGASALAPHYRLAPEHPFPAAVDDALAVYRWMLDQGQAASQLIIAGDSAGGGLTVATAVAARDAGLPLPAALFCISPWTDLGFTGRSHGIKASRDPIVTRQGAGAMAAAYLGETAADTPLASPVHADLTGLPPMLIHCGGEEALLSDSTRLAETAGLAGVHVRLEIWPEMLHVWHFMHQELGAARRAIAEAGAWMSDRLTAVGGGA